MSPGGQGVCKGRGRKLSLFTFWFSSLILFAGIKHSLFLLNFRDGKTLRMKENSLTKPLATLFPCKGVEGIKWKIPVTPVSDSVHIFLKLSAWN